MEDKVSSLSKEKAQVDIGDPYKKWLCDLENNLNYIGELLLNRQSLEAERQMLRVVIMLNSKSKNALKTLKERLEHWVMVSNTATYRDLYAAHDEIYSFLHENYLQESNGYSGIDPNKETEKL